MRHKFKIKTRKDKRYFDVIVYDDRKEMERDADKHNHEEGVNKGILGVCQPFERFIIEGKKEIHHPQIGIIRLYNDIGIGVASHEVLHAALWFYRLKNKVADFGDACSEKEEELGHIFTELVIDLTNKMYKKGIWK